MSSFIFFPSTGDENCWFASDVTVSDKVKKQKQKTKL